MEQSKLRIIYGNLFLCLEKREWTEIPEMLSGASFDELMKKQKYVTISGKNRRGEPSTVLLTNITSNVANHGDDFKRATSGLKGELLLVSNKLMKTNVKQLAKKNYDGRVHSYLHSHFIIDMTRAPMVSEHTIMTPEEIKNEIESHNITRKDLPLIKMSDTQIIWLGALEGDIIRITRFSESSGYSCMYRVVVNK